MTPLLNTTRKALIPISLSVLIASISLSGCGSTATPHDANHITSHNTLNAPSQTESGFPDTTTEAQVTQWLIKNNRNQYGDRLGINYAGGTPLYNEMTGKTEPRYEHLLKKFPHRPWESIQLENPAH